MKGIILAGGTGTRLYPCTNGTSKQLLPVYDKPMIYYPLSTLMFAGIRDILVISTPEDVPKFRNILGDGGNLGIKLSYKVQDKPEGVAHSFILAEDFIGENSVCLVLGDNIFYGDGFPRLLRKAGNLHDGALVFGYWVQDPERYGIINFDESGTVVGLEEKPVHPASNYAIPGLYFYDNNVVQIAKKIKPSKRGELEITDINVEYLNLGKLKVEIIGRGTAWLDTGTPDSLLDASNFIATIENRQGLKIACIEEVAYRMGYVSKEQLIQLADNIPKGLYKSYLEKIVHS